MPEELKPSYTNSLQEAGLDEVGRGCLAGPVVAAAVILPLGFELKDLKDSKRLSPKKREKLEKVIQDEALAWAIAQASEGEIDQLNILNASILAMHRALKALIIQPSLILVDGKQFKPYQEVPHRCFVKGDNKFLSIAAASVLAKNFRDRLMIDLAREYPAYDWENNVGYPTQKHRKAIQQYGPSIRHRKSFKIS